MNTLADCFDAKFKQIDCLRGVKRPQRELKKRVFIKNTLNVLCYLIKDEPITKDGSRFHYIPIYKWDGVIRNHRVRSEVFDFLKRNNIIEVKKKNGVEYYLPQTIACQKLPQCKAYRLTKHGCELILNCPANSLDDLFKQYGVEKKCYVQTPAEIMEQYNDEDYYLSGTRQNIITVLSNNLQLKFHRLSTDEMIKKYKADVACNLTDEEIQDKLQMVQDYFFSKDFTYNIRMYSAFTNCPKSWRDCIVDADNNSIGELFDVHSSVFNLLPLVCRIKLLEEQADLTQFEQEEKFLEEVLNKDIYTSISNGFKTRDKIKAKVMEVVFSNNQKMQGIERTPKGKLKNSSANMIKQWMSCHIPVMYNTLSHFEQERNPKYDEQVQKYKDYLQKRSRGIIVHHVNRPIEYKSTFWNWFQKMETELMANLNQRVSQYFETKIYNIHDGLFAKKSLCTPENKQIVQQMYNDLKKELIQAINAKFGYKGTVDVIHEEKRPYKDFFQSALKKIYRRNRNK